MIWTFSPLFFKGSYSFLLLFLSLIIITFFCFLYFVYLFFYKVELLKNLFSSSDLLIIALYSALMACTWLGLTYLFYKVTYLKHQEKHFQKIHDFLDIQCNPCSILFYKSLFLIAYDFCSYKAFSQYLS